ncbi:MAG: replication initiator protein [Microvirus sp.]|nr:MAG: replication initiator protein [Microvirus sp.]
MTCYHPIKAYRSKHLTVNGKRKLVFSEKDSNGETQEISCGQCIGCRLQRSLEWAARISNEASLYENNCFITLTYAPENLPEGGTLVVKHFQDFMKKLRFKYGPNIRFFHCGEYGEQLHRPHYHAALLNHDFPDKRPSRLTDRGDQTYISDSLDQLWGMGRTEIGELNFDSAAYIARYITKKVTGNAADFHYSTLDFSTGEITRLKPEYITMSRRPGIGAPWLEKYHKDVYSYDKLILRSGAKIAPPRFYDGRYELINPEHARQIFSKREQRDVNMFGTDDYNRRSLDTTENRLKVREVVHEATIKSTLKRNYEGSNHD